MKHTLESTEEVKRNARRLLAAADGKHAKAVGPSEFDGIFDFADLRFFCFFMYGQTVSPEIEKINRQLATSRKCEATPPPSLRRRRCNFG
jgi:hypothetical protein